MSNTTFLWHKVIMTLTQTDHNYVIKAQAIMSVEDLHLPDDAA